jgi:imidazolonepropionase
MSKKLSRGLKGGYELNHEDEIKQLEVLKELHKLQPMHVVTIFMGAHEVPLEYKKRKDDYIELLVQKILSEVQETNLAEFFVVFCGKEVFSLRLSQRITTLVEPLPYGFHLFLLRSRCPAPAAGKLLASLWSSPADLNAVIRVIGHFKSFTSFENFFKT